MASGYSDGAFSGRPFTLRLELSEPSDTPTAGDIAANTSKVNGVLRMIRTGGYTSYNTSGPTFSYDIGGVTGSGSFTYDFGAGGGPTIPIGGSIVIWSGQVTITHQPDGTKSITYSASANAGSPVGTASLSGSLTLTTIPRATTPVLSTSTPDTNSAVTITLTPADAGFSHRLSWAFQPGTSGTALDEKIVGLAGGSGTAHAAAEAASADGTAGNYWGVPSGTRTPTLTIPHAVFAQSVDFATRTVTLTVDTYNGATLIGTKTVTMQVTLAASEKPTIAAITHSEATTSPNVASLIGGYVQSVSKLALALTSPAGIHGSTIASRAITVAGQTLTADGTTPLAVNASGTVAITATVTDSRGRVSDVVTQNVTVLAWAPPVFASVPAVVRALSSGVTDEDDGTYLKVDPADFSVSSLIVSSTQKNKVEYRLSYRLVGAGSWTVDGSGWIDPPNTPSVIRFTGTALSTFASAALGSAYEVLIEIRDVLATSSVQRTVPKAQVLLHLKGALGVSFGARHSGGSNPLEVWGRGKQASDLSTLYSLLDLGDKASDAEAVALSSAVKFITPSNLAAFVPSDTRLSMYERATSAEAIAGSSNDVAMTAARVKEVLPQIVSTHTDVRTFSTTSTTFVDLTGITVTITPKSTGSKILVMVALSIGASSLAHFRILRNGTTLSAGGAGDAFTEWSNTSGADGVSSVVWHYLDSPASVSAQTYKIQCRVNSGTLRLNRRVNTDLYMGTSQITVMEVVG